MVLVGVPGVGKSSFAGRLSAVSGCSVTVLETDRELVTEWSAEGWRGARLRTLMGVKEELGKQFGQTLTVVLVDDNNLLRSMRKQLVKLCLEQEKPVGFLQVWWDFNLETALERNSGRTGKDRIPEDVIRKNLLYMDPPDKEKVWWEAFTIRIQERDEVNTLNQLLQLDRLKKLAQESFEMLRSRKEMVRATDINPRHNGQPEWIHLLDLALRQYVSKILARVQDLFKRDAAAKIRALKLDIMNKASALHVNCQSDLDQLLIVFKSMCEDELSGFLK